jgi:cytochrome c oxidase assembly factor CtaG
MPVSSNGLLVALLHPAGVSVPPASILRTWTFEPGIVLPLVAAIAVYTIGVARLWRAGGAGAGIRRWQVGAFAVGCGAILAALVSPVDAASDQLSFAHMIQHELLMIVAAPLLVAGVPLLAALFALPLRTRRSIAALIHLRPVQAAWRALSAPATVFLLHAVALWTWHIPSLYDSALSSEPLHAVEHASFFATAALFWWGMTRGRYGRQGYGAAVVYVFATAMHSGVLGAALTVSPFPWYAHYASTTGAWGLSPLEDQQLAGLVMWVPAGLVFTAMGLIYFAAWLRESDRRTRFIRTASAAVIALSAFATGGCQRNVGREAAAMTGGDPQRGQHAITQYGCDTCHTIPGVSRAQGKVGPPLGGVASRIYLAGHVPNTPANMEDWIQHPHALDAQTVMPETGISPQEARDVAAYLYTLR